MGSCFSKQDNKDFDASKENTEKAANSSTRIGRVISGDVSNHENTRAAAGRAAQERFNAQQEKTKNSQQKLKAMEKVSRKDKGLV